MAGCEIIRKLFFSDQTDVDRNKEDGVAGTRVASALREQDQCGSLVEKDSQSVPHSPLHRPSCCAAVLLIGIHPRHHPNQKWQPVLCLLSFLWLLHDEEVFERLMARILNDRNIPCQETQQTGKSYPTQGKRKGRGFAESSLSSLPLRSLLWLLLHIPVSCPSHHTVSYLRPLSI